MGDTPEQQATKDALAVQGMWKRGKGVTLEQFQNTDPVANERAKTLGRTLLESALPTALSTAGALGGAAIGGPVAPATAMAGAAAGGATGEAINPYLFEALGLGPTHSMTGSRPWDIFFAGAGGGLGELGGQAAVKVGGKIASRFLPEAMPASQATADAFRATGVQPKVSDVAPNMSALERSVAQTPTGGQIIRDTANLQAGQLTRAKDEFLAKIAPPQAGERVVVGEKVSAAIGRNLERTGALEDALWTQIGHMANDVPVPITRLKAWANDALLSEMRGKDPNQSIVTFLKKIVDDKGEEWAWQVADATRKQFGRNTTGQRGIAEVPESVYKGAYGALLDDMEAAAAASTVPGLGSSYKNLRNFAEHRRDLFRDHDLAKILETDPEKVVDALKISGPAGIQRAREAILGFNASGQPQYVKLADLEAWDYVRRHILEGAFNKAVNEEYKGLANPVIVGSRLEKALKVLGDDGLKELLTPTELAALENIKLVAKAMRSSERIGALPGTSTTPQGMGFMDLFKSPGVLLGTAAGGLLTGTAGGAAAGGAAGGFASFVLVPHILAKALTNPRAVAVIASPGFRALSRGGEVAATEGTKALFRLGGILAAESQGGQ